MACQVRTLLLFFAAAMLWADPLWANPSIDLNRDVRPILADKCFTCHGPDAASKHVPFRLDREDAARRALSGGESSALVRRVTAANPAMRMPPASTGSKLTETEIGALRKWAAEGAKWEKHWSFVPPRRPPPPEVR